MRELNARNVNKYCNEYYKETETLEHPQKLYMRK